MLFLKLISVRFVLEYKESKKKQSRRKLRGCLKRSEMTSFDRVHVLIDSKHLAGTLTSLELSENNKKINSGRK